MIQEALGIVLLMAVGLCRRPGVAQQRHRYRQLGRGGDCHRRAFRGDEGAAGRLLDHSGPDLGVALKLAAEGSKACNRKVEARPFL